MLSGSRARCSLFAPDGAFHLLSAAHLDFHDQKRSQLKAPRRRCPVPLTPWAGWQLFLEQWGPRLIRMTYH